ncbi:MAG: NB-ARC domain-containing protein, partial [Lewinella sp.]
MSTQEKIAHWRTQIAENRLEEVLRDLLQALEQSPKLNAAIQLSGRHADLSDRIVAGIISTETEMIARNRISHSLLLLIDDLADWAGEDEALDQELAKIFIGGDVNNAIIGSTVNAETVHLGDVYYADEAIPHFLSPQPQNPPVFKGREEQLKELHDRLFSNEENHVILLVNGQAGVGKTSMVSRYFFDYHNEYSHVAWVLKGRSIQEAVLTLEQGLNLAFTDETTPQRLSIILQKVANLQAPCLLIIDHVNDHDDLIEHIKILRQCANFHVLVTSRLDYFDGTQTYTLESLPLPVAKTLFEQYYQAFNEEEAALFSEVYRAVDGNTLVLQLLAKNLKKNRRKYFLPDLLADLRSKGVQQLSASREVVTDYGSLNEGGIEEIVAAMYDLSGLDEQQLTLLSVFAALPPEKIPYGHLEILVDFIDDLDEALDELQQHGWLEENQEGRKTSLRCSPVIQAVIRQKNEHWTSVLPSLRYNIQGFIESDQSGNLKAGIKAARPFVVYGEAIARYLPPEVDNFIFYEQLTHFYITSGDLRAHLHWATKSMSLVQELLVKTPKDTRLKDFLAISYEKLGSTHSSLGNLPKALEFFEKRSALGQELHDAYPNNVDFKNGLAISYEKLGSTHSSLGNLPKALEFFEQQSALGQELHADYPDNVGFKNGLAISYEKLGTTHGYLGNLPKALQFFEQLNSLEKELHADYPDNVGFKNGLAVSYEKLGYTHSSLGNLPKAL